MVIALLISSLLAAGLFTTLYQISLVQARVTSITTVYTRAAVFLNQIEHDLMGAFIPTQTKIIQRSAQPGVMQSTEKNVEPVKVSFSSVVRDGQLELLTFITSSPLAVYTKAKNAKQKPCVVRVVYRLVPDKVHKKSYTLLRQEGTELAFEKYDAEQNGALRPYQMLDGIAQMKIQYYIPDPKQEGDKKTIQYKKLTALSGSTSKEGEEEITITSLPHFVEITLSLWDSAYEKQTSFTMTIPLIAPAGSIKPDHGKLIQEQPVAAEKPAAALDSEKNLTPAPEQEKKLVGMIDFLPEKLRSGITIKEGASVERGVAA